MKTFLLGKEGTSVRDSYIWNLIASGVNASEAIIVLMIATRTVGLEDTGILSMAFTLSNLMMTIGKFGVRSYQVTDIKKEYGFSDYFGSRVLTVFAMLAATAVYLFGNLFGGNYSQKKVLIMFGVVMMYALEAFEDVYGGELQRWQRLDIASKIFTLRWAGTLLAWGLSLICHRNTLFSTTVALLVDVVLFIWFMRILCDEFREIHPGRISVDWHRARSLTLTAISLFLSTFLSYYITNASKYAIDACLTDDIQAYYGFVSMPVFVIGLLNSIIYQPIVVKMSIEWQERRMDSFVRRILHQMVLIVLISSVCILAAWFWGIPVLSWLYATDLTNYKFELIILLIGGMWLAYVGFFYIVAIMMRKQKRLLVVYVAIALLAVLMSKRIVVVYGVAGAAVANMVWMLLESLAFGVIVLVCILRGGE